MKVFIPESIPSFNKGEAAIFWGIVETLSFNGKSVEIYLSSNNPEYDRKSYGQEAEIVPESLIPHKGGKFERLGHFAKSATAHLIFLFIYYLMGKGVTRLFSKPLWKAYLEADAIILGHDNAFSRFHNFLILFSKCMKKPIVIYGASVLPYNFKGTIVRKLTRFCINQVNLVTTRENYSAEFLKDLGVKESLIHVTADKAFLLKPAAPERGIEILRKEGINTGHRPIIGFTVVKGSGVFRYGLRKITDIEERHRYHVETVASVIDQIIQKYKAQIIFIPHVIGAGIYDDRKVASDVHKLVINKEYVKVMKGDYFVDELKSVLGHLDFLVGERTHSLIGAACMGVPFVAISYPEDYRTYGILGEMLGQKQLLYNIEGLDAKSLLRKFDSVWNQRGKVAKDLNCRIPDIQKRAMENGKLFFDMLKM